MSNASPDKRMVIRMMRSKRDMSTAVRTGYAFEAAAVWIAARMRV